MLPFIVAAERSGLHVNGDGPAVLEPASDRDRLLNAFTEDLPAYWAGERFDAATMQGALEYLRTRQPRVLYVMLGETDEWAHGRRYDLYLDAAWRSDRFVRRLWEEAQSLPAYRGRTALVLATDHGRGAAPLDWTDHGQKVPAAEPIWMAVMGPRHARARRARRSAGHAVAARRDRRGAPGPGRRLPKGTAEGRPAAARPRALRPSQPAEYLVFLN